MIFKEKCDQCIIQGLFSSVLDQLLYGPMKNKFTFTFIESLFFFFKLKYKWIIGTIFIALFHNKPEAIPEQSRETQIWCNQCPPHTHILALTSFTYTRMSKGWVISLIPEFDQETFSSSIYLICLFPTPYFYTIFPTVSNVGLYTYCHLSSVQVQIIVLLIRSFGIFILLFIVYSLYLPDFFFFTSLICLLLVSNQACTYPIFIKTVNP